MKRIFLLLSLLFSFVASWAQDLPDFSAIKLEKQTDYNANANNAALKAASYLLATPADKENANWQNASKYLILWMAGSPAYSFTIDAALGKLVTSDKEGNLMIIGMAALAEYALKHPDMKDEHEIVKLHAIKRLIKYVSDPANNIKPKGVMKKAIEANDAGKLNDYLATLN